MYGNSITTAPVSFPRTDRVCLGIAQPYNLTTFYTFCFMRLQLPAEWFVLEIFDPLGLETSFPLDPNCRFSNGSVILHVGLLGTHTSVLRS